MKNKKRSISKFVRIKRNKLFKIMGQLHDAIAELECLDFDIPGQNDRYNLSNSLVTLNDIEQYLNKEMGVI